MMARVRYHSIAVDESGIAGNIELAVSDIDYDKDIRLLYTTDNWATQHELVVGSEGANRWVWQYDEFVGLEVWRLDLDLAGDFDHIEFAVVYRHGVQNGADVYEYWDNNYGQNFRVEKTAP